MSLAPAGDDSPRRARAFETVAHRPLMVGGVITALIVTGTVLGPTVHDVLYLVASAIGLLWTGAQMHHNARDHLCVRCMHDMPSNPGAAARRGRRWLRLHHRIMDSRPWTFGYVLLILLCCTPGILGWRPGAWLIFLPQAAFAWLSLNHRRVRPWCPYCRGWGDGGPHERTPEPDPAGARTTRS